MTREEVIKRWAGILSNRDISASSLIVELTRFADELDKVPATGDTYYNGTVKVEVDPTEIISVKVKSNRKGKKDPHADDMNRRMSERERFQYQFPDFEG